MNTHLHILEPYTNLYRVWKDERLHFQLKNLIELFADKILDEQTCHLNLFFEDNWLNKYHIISYGHDIEASWLLHEAALVLDDTDVLSRIEPLVVGIAKAAGEGLLSDGSLVYEHFPLTEKLIGNCIGGCKQRMWWVISICINILEIQKHWKLR